MKPLVDAGFEGIIAEIRSHQRFQSQCQLGLFPIIFSNRTA